MTQITFAESGQTRSATDQVRRLLRAFLEANRIKDLSADGLRLWVDALADLTVEQVERGIRCYMRDPTTKFPTPAEIRRYAGVEDRAETAWDAVRRAIGSAGAFASVTFDDQLVNAAVRAIGGWIDLCDTRPDEMKWRRRDFIEAYDRIARTGIGDPAHLPGIAEIENHKRGYPPPDIHTVRIGLPVSRRPVLEDHCLRAA